MVTPGDSKMQKCNVYLLSNSFISHVQFSSWDNIFGPLVEQVGDYHSNKLSKYKFVSTVINILKFNGTICSPLICIDLVWGEI